MNKKKIGINFGALADPIEKQLEKQGLKTSPENIERFNDLHHARLMLLFGGCLSDSENNRTFKKINNELKKSVKPIS